MKIKSTMTLLAALTSVLSTAPATAGDWDWLQDNLVCSSDYPHAPENYVCRAFFNPGPGDDKELTKKFLNEMLELQQKNYLPQRLTIKHNKYSSDSRSVYGTASFIKSGTTQKLNAYFSAIFTEVQDDSEYFYVITSELVDCPEARKRLKDANAGSDYESIWRAEALVTDLCND